MSDGPIRIFDLETKLAEDENGSFRKSLVDELADELHEVKQKINAGLPPNEFQRASTYATAIEKASAVVEKVWTMGNKS